MYKTELWADCPGYEGLYQVSDRGRVFNCQRRKYLRGTITASGYRQVRLSYPGKRIRCFLVHALVLSAFVGPRPPGFVCDHLSGNRLENTLSNLEWVTPGENLRRAYRAGRFKCTLKGGEGHYGAKLTDEKVRAIRKKRVAGVSTKVLAKEYRVGTSAISKVVSRATWKHVP